MKVTKDRLTQMIREAVVRISERDEGEESANEADQILEKLKDILREWEEAEYESDEERWQDYAEDIQSLVNDYEGEDEGDDEGEEPKKKNDKDWGGNKGDDDRSAMKRGDKKHSDYETTKKGDKTAKGTSAYSHQKAPSGPKSGGPKLAKMTYEAKKLEEAVYKKLKTMLKKRRSK